MPIDLNTQQTLPDTRTYASVLLYPVSDALTPRSIRFQSQPFGPPPTPAFPPIGIDSNSRLIYHSLTEENAKILQEYTATGWQPLSVAILDSEDEFVDSALIEGMWMQNLFCDKGVSPYNKSHSRSLVTLGQVRGQPSDCIQTTPGSTREIFYRNRECTGSREPSEEYNEERPLEFQAKCIVILIEDSSRKALLDTLVRSGRRIDLPLRVSVNFTTALSPDPDLEISSMNCAVGNLIYENARRDMIGQDLEKQLYALQQQLEQKELQVEVFDRTMRGLSAYRPPNSPPPPSQPPRPSQPPGQLAPPHPPALVSFTEYLAQLRDQQTELEKAIDAKLIEIGGPCVPSASNFCGRTHRSGPDPWIAADGSHCSGYETREAIEGAFCAHWGSPNNVAAAYSEEAEELLTEAPPWCYNEYGVITACSPIADRAIRAGVYELQEMARVDRSYCSSRLYRDLFLENPDLGEAACRANLTARNRTCGEEICEQCRSQCNYPTARDVAKVLKCTIARSHWAFTYCKPLVTRPLACGARANHDAPNPAGLQVSDAGQLARASHGAIRGDQIKAVPEKLASHAYAICHNNPDGYVQRDSVSCRMEHRNSPVGRFVPGFDEKTGNPVARGGYIVPCKRHSDCYTRCPKHPLTGGRYQCQKTHRLYDVPFTHSNDQLALMNLDQGSGDEWDPDTSYVAITNETGICVDVDSSLNQGCQDETAAKIVDGVLGCADRRISMFLCGLQVTIKDGDISTASMDGNFFYSPPRMLLAAGVDIDGEGNPNKAVTCMDPIDCVNKCRYLERTSKGGMGAPPACAACDLYCSSNILTTIVDLVDAIWFDVMTVVRLIAVCFGKFGLSGCLCQLSITLQPAWRRFSTNKQVRCEQGDAFLMIVTRINDEIVKGAESMLNWVIDRLNDFIDSLPWPFDNIGRPIGRVCFPTQFDPDRCVGGYPTPEELAKMALCESSIYGLENMCFYARVRQICSSEEMLLEYRDLFAQGFKTVDEVEAEFSEAFGESFREVDPTLAALMEQVEISSYSGPDLEPRRDICSTNAFASSMTLDMVIVSCIFAEFEKHCPPGATSEDDQFEFFVDSIEFELPKVRFSYDVSPPPPPPAILPVYQQLVAQDPHGFQLVRAKLEEIFPRLSDVSTSSIGGSVGASIVPFNVPSAIITKAYLSSYGMTPDGLGARVIESKHTGRWRPACKEMFNLFDDRKQASAGFKSQAYKRAGGNPHFSEPSFESNFDRNLLLYAMLEIKLSLDKDSLANVEYGTLALYDTICGSGVGGHRVPVDVADYDTYDFTIGYDIHTFAPIVNFGSLESVRSAYFANLQECRQSHFQEDMAQYVFCGGLGAPQLPLDAAQRSLYAPFAMHRDRICSPKVELSIEDTLARPPFFETELYDTPIRSKLQLDAWIVPTWSRGEENISPEMLQRSLKSWVYITSSADPSIRPGMHRLLEIPVFADKGCQTLPSVDCSAPEAPTLRLNPGDQYLATHDLTATYTRGRLMMRTIRCSPLVEAFTGQSCIRQPFLNMPGCSQENLYLLSRPTYYSSRMWLKALVAPPPSPPPASPLPPPIPGSPPPPSPSPAPPFVESQWVLMERIREIEEAACTSVYYLTTTTRCERLAVALTQSVLYARISPPSPPPASPLTLMPPPPEPPPSPSYPSGIVQTGVTGSRLSTVRVPAEARRRLNLYDDGLFVQSGELSNIASTLATTEQTLVARCSSWQPNAVLPCVSASLESACISMMRHCGTIEENLNEPFLELYFAGPPSIRGNRLWAVEIRLPQNEELASLFFRSAEGVGGVGYYVDCFDSNGASVKCAQQSEQSEASSVTSDRIVQHLFAGSDFSDGEMAALGSVVRLRITLKGTYRQIWLRYITVLEVSVASTQLTLPPPVAMLDAMPPTAPNSPPTGGCRFSVQSFYNDRVEVFKEPCGMSMEQCCDHMRNFNGTDSFEIDDAGCCLLTRSGAGAVLVADASRFGYLSTRSGTGV